MAQYNFKGDLENISDRQLEFINDVIIKKGFDSSQVTFEKVGQAGDNYIASVKRIIVEGEHDKFSMVAKIAPSIEMMRMMTHAEVLFKNEQTMYNTILPKMLQLQKDAGIPKEEQLRYAECYGTLAESQNEVILLEDLKTSNFIMLDRFQSLSDECIRSVLKNFAVYHSLSYVLRQKEPDTYENFKTALLDPFTTGTGKDAMKKYFEGLERDTIAMLDEPAHKDCVKFKVGSAIDALEKLLKDLKDSKYTVIQQGDSWTNNIMFQFENDRLKESIMIDYQLSKNNSPASDLLYTIFNCTDYESRKQNYYAWIDYYHSELDNCLSNFGLKASYIYPRDKLDADLKLFGKLMFGLCVTLANVLTIKPADAAAMMETMKTESMFDIEQDFTVARFDEESKNRYKNRIIGLINSFNEFGLL